jgi:predicted enzyme related to lactoylglutathione lyase
MEQVEKLVDNSITTASKNFNNFVCLYLPADDPQALAKWYTEHFNSPETRKYCVFWETTKEKGTTCNFMTDEYIPGKPYEMFTVRFETDCIEALYERLSNAGVPLEPLLHSDHEGITFVFTDPQGSKFQVRQHADTEIQPLRDDVPALIEASALFFPASDPEATRKWYSELLGLELNDSGWPKTRNGEEICFYRSLIPGQTTNFHKNVVMGDRPSTLYSIINVAVDDLGEMHKRMREQGQKVEIISDRGGCGRQFQLYDPDGNMLDIWETQTMIHKEFNYDSGDWKQQYKIEGDDIDTFLAGVTSDLNHRRIVIPGHNILNKLDPEGLESLLETLNQFSLEHPHNPFEIIKRDWSPTEVTGPTAMEHVADSREVFIPPTERAEGILKIYGRPWAKDSLNWKDRIVLQIPFFVFEIDTFFTKALEGCHEIFRQVQIVYDEASVPWYLSKIDPDAVRELKLAVELFNQEHPEHAIELIE